MTHAYAFYSEDGATAVEYGIMVALIAVVIVSAVFSLGTRLGDDYECVEQHITDTPTKAPTPC